MALAVSKKPVGIMPLRCGLSYEQAWAGQIGFLLTASAIKKALDT